MSHLSNISTRDREILRNRPGINFNLPDRRIGRQGTKTEERSIEQRAEEVSKILNGYKHIEVLSALAQAKIDARSKNFAIPLDLRVDQSVISSMRRAFPGETPTRITHDQYRRSLEYLSASAINQSKQYRWTKEERKRKKDSGEILTNIWKDRMKPGGLRPELEHEIIPQLDMDEHQKSLVLILFEQMLPLFVDLIKSIIDPLFSSGGTSPGELNSDNLDIPTEISSLQDQINTRATEMIQNRDKNKLTSAFSIPQLSLVEESVGNQGINPVSVADAALISQMYERGAHFTLDPVSALPPLSRMLHGNKVMSRSVVDTLTQQHIQTNTDITQQERQFVRDGLPEEDSQSDKKSSLDKTLEEIARFKQNANIGSDDKLDDFADAALIDTFNREDPKDFVNFLDDQVQRRNRSQSETITADGVFNGLQFSNTFTKSQQTGRDFLADCIPCADRILDILEFQPGGALLDLLNADLSHRLNGLNSIGDLLTDDSFRREFCALIRFLSFMCIPDLQAIVAALISLVMSLLTSPFGLIGIGDLLLNLITPLFTPILNGLSGLIDQLLQLLTGPLICIMDSFNAQIAKLNVAGILDPENIESERAKFLMDFPQQTSIATQNIRSNIRTGVDKVRDRIDDANQFLFGRINTAIADAHNNLLLLAEKVRKDLGDMLLGWAKSEDDFLLSTAEIASLKRLIGVVLFVIDAGKGHPACRDPFAEGSVTGAAKKIADELFTGWNISVNEETGSLQFNEAAFELPPDLQEYRGSPEAGPAQKSTRFDSLVEFAGEDLVHKLSEPTDVSVPLSVLCGGKTSSKHVDTINSIIRDLNRVTI